MKNEHFMKEYWHFNGDYNVIFNLIEVNTENMTVAVAINNFGKLSQQTNELREKNGRLYFEYDVMNDKIFIDDFEDIEGATACMKIKNSEANITF